MGEINHFLIVFDLANSELVELRRFGTDVDEATEAYAEIEREWRDRDDSSQFEIVLVGADSEDTLHVTHSRYFTKPGLTRLY
jgi:hypothetical protein